MNSCSNHLASFCGQEDPQNPRKFKPHKNYQPYNITYTHVHIYCTLIYKDMCIYIICSGLFLREIILQVVKDT